MDSFILLERFFEDLKMVRRTGGALFRESCIEDDLETLNLFAAVIQELQTYGFEVTEASSIPQIRSTPHQAFGAMLRVFRDFTSEVDQTYLSIQVGVLLLQLVLLLINGIFRSEEILIYEIQKLVGVIGGTQPPQSRVCPRLGKRVKPDSANRKSLSGQVLE